MNNLNQNDINMNNLNQNDIQRMEILDQLDQLDQNVDTINTNDTNVTNTNDTTQALEQIKTPNETPNETPNPTTSSNSIVENYGSNLTRIADVVDEQIQKIENLLDTVDANDENSEPEDIRVVAYLQCKSLESYAYSELDKHLKKQHNVQFDKGGYINLYTKMFLADCKTCGAGWNMYKVDPHPEFGNAEKEKISHFTAYKGYSVHSNLANSVGSGRSANDNSNSQEKGWGQWWEKHSELSDKIKYQPYNTSQLKKETVKII